MRGAVCRRTAVDREVFHEHFWQRREPLIVTGVGLAGRYGGWDAERVFGRLREVEGEVDPQKLWYDMAAGVLLGREDLPPWVVDHVYGEGHVTRRKHHRLFFHPKGHTTGLHYEGNLLDIFSLQCKGVKRWKLLRGDVAHKLLPFYFVDNQATYDPMGEEPAWTYVEDLGPDELLFLPRGWYHHVECLSDDNVALSLVSAPKDRAALDEVTLRIYREQLALQYHLRGVLPARFRHKIETFLTYEPDGLGWARHFVEDLPKRAILKRLLIDVGVTTPAVVGTLMFNQRTRAYMGYLSGFEDELRARLRR